MVTSITRHSVRDLLEEWASENEQRRLWLSDGANGAEVSSFTEACEGLLTDTGFGDELDRGRLVFDPSADAMLKKLRALMSVIDADRAPHQIIADPQMHEVRLLASQLLVLIQAPSI